jgi:hypothetical protein
MFFNFWQMAFVSHHVDKAHAPVSNLRRLWQKRDYAMLKLCFGNRI